MNPLNIGVPLQCWYLSTEALDGLGNPCSGASDNCAALVDQSGNNYSVEQSTAANRPIWLPNQIAGLPAIQFGATSAAGLYNTNSWTVPAAITILFVVNVTSTSPNLYPTLCYLASTTTTVYFPQNTNTFTSYLPTNTYGAVALNTWHYGGVVLQNANSLAHFDGFTYYGPESGGGSPGSELCLGGAGFGNLTDVLPCLLAEFMIFNGALTPVQLTQMDSYFQARYAAQFPTSYGVENYASRAEISFQAVAPPPAPLVSFWRRRVSGRQPTDRSPALPGGPAGV